jgi:hypothetical protein
MISMRRSGLPNTTTPTTASPLITVPETAHNNANDQDTRVQARENFDGIMRIGIAQAVRSESLRLT